MPEDNSIACRLSDAAFREREATLLAKIRSLAVATQELPDGYAFRIPGNRNCLSVLSQFMAAERECCPFLTFALTLHPDMGPIEVLVTGPTGSKDILRFILSGSTAPIHPMHRGQL